MKRSVISGELAVQGKAKACFNAGLKRRGVRGRRWLVGGLVGGWLGD